jgi:hypothetical protein
MARVPRKAGTVLAGAVVLATSVLAGTGGQAAMAANHTALSTIGSTYNTKGIPKLAFKGTITMYASTYTPVIPGVKLQPGQVPLHALDQAAAAFEKLYPGIHVKFLPSTSEEGQLQWYATEGVAGTLPDVSWVQGPYVNVDYPKGLFYNLKPYFNQSNPYIPGKPAWLSTMNQTALQSDIVPNNAGTGTGIYAIDGDWQGFTFWYNKKMFRKAGITTAPTSWVQMLADDRKLKAHGMYAGGTETDVIWNWFAHMFIGNYLGVKRDRVLVGVKGNQAGALTGVEEQYFYNHYGDWLNPSDPRLLAWTPFVRSILQTWDPKVTNVTFGNASSAPNPTTLFLDQKIATLYIPGFQVPKLMQAMPKSQRFAYGTFNLTNFQGTSGKANYATNLQTYQDVGGPYAGFQFAISTHRGDSTMTPAKFQAAKAWLQFITTPYWDGKIVNEEGEAIPIIKGAYVPTAIRPFLYGINHYPFWSICPWDTYESNALPMIDGLFLEYANGYINFSSYKQQFTADVAKLYNEFNAQNKALVAKFTKQENKKLGVK